MNATCVFWALNKLLTWGRSKLVTWLLSTSVFEVFHSGFSDQCFIKLVNIDVSLFKKQKTQKRNSPNSDMVQFSWHVSMFSSRNNNQDFILENFLIFARKTKSSFDSVKSFTAFCSALYECKPFWEIYEITLSKMLYYKTIQDTLTMVKILWFLWKGFTFAVLDYIY